MTIFIEGSLLGLSIVPRGLKGNMSLDSLKSHSIGGVVEWTELTEASQGPRYQPDQESQFPVVWAASDMGTPMWCGTGTGWFQYGVVLGGSNLVWYWVLLTPENHCNVLRFYTTPITWRGVQGVRTRCLVVFIYSCGEIKLLTILTIS